jgi:histidine triad (HIT) family protein
MYEQDIQSNETIFGKILRGEIPCNKVYEDEHILAFHDISPAAKVHALVIPKKLISSVNEASEDDLTLLGHLQTKIPEIAKLAGCDKHGYRVITNVGPNAGQEVFHVHYHILGGEKLSGLNPML